jgi:hypothetical protein
MADRELGDTIPTFNQPAADGERRVDITNLTALTSTLGGIRTWAEIGAIALVAVLIVGGTEVLLRVFEVPHYIMPTPSQIAAALVSDFHLLAPHIGVTLTELLVASRSARRSASCWPRSSPSSRSPRRSSRPTSSSWSPPR